MIDGRLFDKLVSCPSSTFRLPRRLMLTFQEYIARTLRRNNYPFGGIQVGVRSFPIATPHLIRFS